jgi:hypothetical protein
MHNRHADLSLAWNGMAIQDALDVHSGSMAVSGSSDILELAGFSFEQVFAEMKANAFGAEYACLDMENGGKLFLTSYGWPWLAYLLPGRWYENNRFVVEGWRQPCGVGTVYRVPVYDPGGQGLDLVVKFSRFAQSTMLYAGSNFPANISPAIVASARINSPFEEIGLLMKLRHRRIGGRPSISTKTPLAVYCPPAIEDFSRFGRTESRFKHCQQAMEENQSLSSGGARIELDIARQYILLYQWVEGENASVMQKRGFLSCDEVHSLTGRVNEELKSHGFRVLDYKPEHIILRVSANGSLLRHNGELMYTLVDYELLEKI